MPPRATASLRLLPVLAACVVAAGVGLGLGGCGDGSLSAGDLRAQASAICARSADAAAAVALPASEDGGGTFLAAGVTRMRPALADLEKLKPPGDLREGYEQALHVRRQEIELIARDGRVIARGGDAVATFRSLQTALAPLESLEDATWRALQVPTCAPR